MNQLIRTFTPGFISLVYILSLATISTAIKLSSSSQHLCQQLETLENYTITSNEVIYETLRTKNWVETAWGEPACIFKPRLVSELQIALPLIVDSNVSFAIRSGGHSPHHGFANSDGGVLIDMGNFDRLDLNQEDQVASIGPGLTWGDVYTYLESYQYVVVGGRVLDVGVGGLTLGSGLSWLTDLYGLACDNMVLANGSLVHASNEENTDLFWALKGGGNNFGIITELSLSAYPLGKIWGGIKKYDIKDLPVVMDAYYEYQSAANKDPHANLIILTSATNASVGIWVSMIYLKPQENPAAFSAFYGINTISDSTAIKKFTEYMAEYAIPKFERLDWHAISFVRSQSLYKDIVDIIVNSSAVETMQSLAGGFMTATIQPISPRVAQQGKARGGNTLGLVEVDQTWLAFTAAWLQPDDDQTAHAAGDSIIEEVLGVSEIDDNYIPFIFMNDASWSQDVIGSYGEENIRRLKQVQEQYDPDKVFQRMVPGGFKLP
ncbi:putative FAD-binding oxidoreductase [Annulohypoxylon maeteangense]|uniref:putative FAD-binding oxidoreductase n=1 Tax=Annulohypoxylon maeteangense TaxID=1927788 RepID=UPI0020079D73|nr:putative FAD-binding oxidoreductase [Annulohypoxylon maeteangense]KAI0886385.1 putative FAD-binding oxidoreductase [Annulohypoxylon maeteangense]